MDTFTPSPKFAAEWRAYLASKERLLPRFEGCVLIVCGDEVLGPYADEASAYAMALKAYGSNAHFMMHDLHAVEPVFVR